jgi:hypothetical protein
VHQDDGAQDREVNGFGVGFAGLGWAVCVCRWGPSRWEHSVGPLDSDMSWSAGLGFLFEEKKSSITVKNRTKERV